MSLSNIKHRVLMLMFAASAASFGQTPYLTQEQLTGPQPTSLDGATTYTYKSVGTTQLRLHVFKPSTSRPAPAIVFFFGGSWTIGSILHFLPQARHLSQRGMVAIIADYRVFSRYGTSAFDSMADAKSAMRWVRTHAAELKVDPKRLVAAGGSAGGHIALSTAVFDTFDESSEDRKISSKPNALLLFNPEVDTTDSPSHQTFPDLRARFGNRALEGSPIHHLSKSLPPTLILHGKADGLVAFADVERFCNESRKLGNQCRVVGYEGADHGFFNPDRRDGTWYRETLLEADRFLTDLRYLPGPVPTTIVLPTK